MMVITSLHDMDHSIWQTNRIYLCEGVEVNFRDLPVEIWEMWPRVFDWTRELDYRCCSSHGIPKESLQHARKAEIA